MAGREVSTTLTVRDWELLSHALVTTAGRYRGDSPGHEGVSEELDALRLRLQQMWGEGRNVATDRP